MGTTASQKSAIWWRVYIKKTVALQKSAINVDFKIFAYKPGLKDIRLRNDTAFRRLKVLHFEALFN